MEIKMNNKRKILAVSIAIISFIFLFAYDYGAKKIKDVDTHPLVNNGNKKNEVISQTPFENIGLEAKSAYVFDILNNKPIFELNAKVQLPLASLTKIMTAIVAKEKLPEWLKVKIPMKAILQEGDSGFLAGERWKITNLLEAMLISSSNDAAYAIAMSIDTLPKNSPIGEFISLMNRKAKNLGLEQTYFLNPTGLDLSISTASAYGSAKDVARLLGYAFKKYPSLFEVTRYNSLDINSREFKNTDKLAKEIPGLTAGKTGFSDLAGGNLAIITDIGLGHPVVIVVLGSSVRGRFKDVKKLYGETLKLSILQ